MVWAYTCRRLQVQVPHNNTLWAHPHHKVCYTSLGRPWGSVHGLCVRSSTPTNLRQACSGGHRGTLAYHPHHCAFATGKLPSWCQQAVVLCTRSYLAAALAGISDDSHLASYTSNPH